MMKTKTAAEIIKKPNTTYFPIEEVLGGPDAAGFINGLWRDLTGALFAAVFASGGFVC
jgi:hypothetical protein